jgi:hypothetical protein
MPPTLATMGRICFAALAQADDEEDIGFDK